MPARKLIFVGGGARSGKSRFALQRAQELGPRRIFVATAQPLDDEMATRIDRHRRERGEAFQTIEEPLALAATLDDLQGRADSIAPDVVLVDCLTLWLSNLLVGGADGSEVRKAFAALDRSLEQRRAHVILVSNEVGMGLVPETALGRVFRDELGELHRRVSVRADEIYFAAMGVVLRLRPNPIEVVA